MHDLNDIDKPLNVNERYLYNINMRLNILIEMMSSFLEVYAAQNKVATVSNKVVEKKQLNQRPLNKTLKSLKGRKRLSKWG